MGSGGFGGVPNGILKNPFGSRCTPALYPRSVYRPGKIFFPIFSFFFTKVIYSGAIDHADSKNDLIFAQLEVLVILRPIYVSDLASSPILANVSEGEGLPGSPGLPRPKFLIFRKEGTFVHGMH